MALEKDDIAGLHQWLKEHGVERKHAETFCARSGCRNIASMALYLRFQVPNLPEIVHFRKAVSLPSSIPFCKAYLVLFGD